MKIHNRFGLILAMAVCTYPGAVRAALIDFNTPGDLSTNFNLNFDPGGTNKYFQVASGGLGNSGAVDLLNTTDADHTTAVYNGGSYSLAAPGDSVTISQFILRRTASITQTPFMELGLVSDPNERMDAGANINSYACIRLDPVSTAIGTDVSTVIETKINGGSRIRTTVAPARSLVAGHWYLLSVTLAYNSSTDLLASGSLDDWGTTGAAFSSSVMSFGPTAINLSGTDQINGDSSVWAAFRGFHEGGSDIFDNFSSTPEPTALSMLLCIVAVLRRRR